MSKLNIKGENYVCIRVDVGSILNSSVWPNWESNPVYQVRDERSNH